MLGNGGISILNSKLFLLVVITVLVSTLAISVPEAEAQINGFQGPYDPSNWTFSTDLNGFVTTTGAPTTIALFGVDSGSGCFSCVTDFAITIPVSGTLSFDWDYRSFDVDGPFFDRAQYAINGVVTQLSNNGGPNLQSGSVSVQVAAGDTFLFRIFSTDGILGRGAFTSISNFVGPGGGGGGSPWEDPSLGPNSSGIMKAKNGICINITCWDVTQNYHVDFELYEMLTGTNTISLNIWCPQGVASCNYVGLGITPPNERQSSSIWSIAIQKDLSGEWKLTKDDSEGRLGNITFTVQEIGNQFLSVSFTIDIKNLSTDKCWLWVELRDTKRGVNVFIFNDGVKFIDIHAYPYVETAFEKPLKVEPICLNEDPDYRNSCAFEKKRDWATSNAEQTLKQMLNNQYVYN